MGSNDDWNNLLRLLCECGDEDIDATLAVLRRLRLSQKSGSRLNLKKLRVDRSQPAAFRIKKQK